MPIPKQVPPVRAEQASRAPLNVIWNSLGATAAVAAVGILALVASGYTPWASAKTGDSITQQEAAARETAFTTQPALGLSLVSDSDVRTAVEQMGLAPDEKKTLLVNLSAPAPTAPAADAATKFGESVSQPAPQEPARLRLAWITLWDTDAEDGDAVRIDSAGFSRTLTLSKQPVTIAIPVPTDSIVKVTGIRDGEGGGITVGLASGGARAVFPIMSVGQVLGLRVQVNR